MTALARSEHAKAKTREFAVPDDIVPSVRYGSVHRLLVDLRHRRLRVSSPVLRKHCVSKWTEKRAKTALRQRRSYLNQTLAKSQKTAHSRSEERREGQEWVRTGRSRRATYP